MSVEVLAQHSSYTNSLDEAAKICYGEKISVVKGFDLLLGAFASKGMVSSQVDAADLLTYLVLETSFITLQQMKARKSLEAYNQFVSGWVKDVKSYGVEQKYVTVAQLLHSQRFLTHCWIITEPGGEVLCTLWNCMAGLGKTCTYATATLFFLEASV